MSRLPLWLGAAMVAGVVTAGAAAWLTRAPETAPPPRLSKAQRARLAAQPPVAAPAPAPAPAAVAAAPPDPVPKVEAPAPKVEPAAPKPPDKLAAVPTEPPPADWTTLPIDDLRRRADAGEASAMEELARRLLQGDGVAKDIQGGAGWMLRAAERGSTQAAFNIGVMYERGFVVDRDSSKAVAWYGKAADGGLATAQHNLALLLRDGKGAPRDPAKAADLLRAASRQAMAASMYALGDMYERGEIGQKDLAMALAWFAMAAEVERQAAPNGDSPLVRMADQRAVTLQRIMLPGEVERAREFGQAELKRIVEGLQPKPVEPPKAAAPPPDPDPPGWPSAPLEQVRAIQQALLDLKLLRDKPDGFAGPNTRNAIKAFQKSIGQAESGEPTREVFAALQEALAKQPKQ
ncbi:MAG: SEL1-like repeat protein [Proteobacteria bacterium]|nr:SEL1-like repeat protein [Pseudomonadota bacterium]